MISSTEEHALDSDLIEQRRLDRVAAVCALSATTVGLSVLGAWAVGAEALTSVGADRSNVKLNTAVALVLLGVALFLLVPHHNPKAPAVGRSCGVVAGSIGGLTLVQYRTGWDLGIDQLLRAEGVPVPGSVAPGRMAESSALYVLMLGSAVLGLDARAHLLRRLARWLGLLVLVAAYLAVLGYAYGASALYSWSAPTQMSFGTALGLLVVAVGVVFARPGGTVASMFVSVGPDGALVRRTVPVAFVMLTVLGAVSVNAVGSEVFDHQFAVSLGVVVSISVVCGLVLVTAAQLRWSEQRRARAQAESDVTNRRLQAIIDQLPAGVHIKDLQGRYQLVNERLEAFFGRPRGSMLGRTAAELFPPAFAASIEALDRRTLAHLAPVEIEETAEIDGQHRTFLSLRFPLMHANGQPVAVCGISTDITERVAEQHEREAFRKHRAEAERFEALGKLAGGVAHDFNNLLTIILGYAGFLAAVVEDDDRATGDVAQIRQAARRGADLTQALLAFSRQETTHPVAVDLNQLVTETRDLLQRTLGADVDVAVSTDPDLSRVEADPATLSQVLLNLAVNARQAMPDGGHVSIETANIDLANSVDGVPAGRYVRVTVADSGHGMTPEVRKRAFDPFFTTKAKGGGTGLGLASALGTVTQAGGHIRLYSEPGIGTAVKIYLPAAGGDASPDPAAPSTQQSAPPPGRTVLLVDDEEAVRNFAARILRAAGLEVEVAPDGEIAWQILTEDGPVDLLLTDVVMPGVSGPEIASRVAKHRPELPVLFMSGYPEGVLTRGGRLGSGVRLLEKPFGEEDLLRAVAEALRSDERA